MFDRANIFATPIVLFWFFMTCPRVWYFYRAGLPVDTDLLSGFFAPIILGFLRDGMLAGIILIPFQIFYLLKSVDHSPGRAAAIVRTAMILLFFLLLSAMMIDVEYFRYFGAHFNSTHFHFLSDWSYISSSFFSFASPPVMAFELFAIPGCLLFAALKFRFRRINSIAATPRAIYLTVIVIAAGAVVQYAPAQTPLVTNLTENYNIAFVRHLFSDDEIEDDKSASIAKIIDTLPLRNVGGGGDRTPSWLYPDQDYPLIKATMHHLCKLGKLPASACGEDRDGDGYVLMDDCNDLDPDVHPGAFDTPRNGIDEDCSGCDAEPPNIIYIHWEGVRAVNVDSVGYSIPSTPNFSNIATTNGVLFANAYANGAQTRWSLISIYCSTLPRLSTEWIFKHNPGLDLLAFPAILRDRGYETIYLHGGYIGFSNKTDRFKEWFETRLDRSTAPIKDMEVFNWGVKDRDLFNLAYDVIKERSDSRPFYMTIATLSMHHPFKLPEKEFETGDHNDKKNQLANLARYSDDAMCDFIGQVLADEELENTIIVVSSDHGINWFNPHKEREQNILWEDLVWVPLALIGKNWNITPGINHEVRQLADIGPTILDRLGIEVPNPFIGHSLLRRFDGRQPRAFFATANGGASAGMRQGRHKYFTHFNTSKEYLFDVLVDRKEQNNLINGAGYDKKGDYYNDMVSAVYSQNTELIETNRIWSGDYWSGD